MSEQTRRVISITLSPTQVDDVLRAAAESRAPSLVTVITASLNAPRDIDPAVARASGPARDAARQRSRAARGHGYAALDAGDHRLSRSLLRGLSILTRFGADGEARGIVELADDLEMSPSTAHRYALTLVELGLLERCPKSRKYRLPGTAA